MFIEELLNAIEENNKHFDEVISLYEDKLKNLVARCENLEAKLESISKSDVKPPKQEETQEDTVITPPSSKPTLSNGDKFIVFDYSENKEKTYNTINEKGKVFPIAEKLIDKQEGFEIVYDNKKYKLLKIIRSKTQ